MSQAQLFCLMVVLVMLGMCQGYKPGELVNITCSEQEVIRVSSAVIRRQEKQTKSSCNPTQNVRDVCNGKRNCEFIVNKQLFPCSFDKKCGLVRSRLDLQYECIPDPCFDFCCTNGGQCELTDPQMDNFDPRCKCSMGQNCEACSIDPCSDFCCANGGICELTDPMLENSDPTCKCSLGYVGQHCEECSSDGFPCHWRNRTFNVYTNGNFLRAYHVSADGTRLEHPTEVITVAKVLGSFLIVQYPDSFYACHKIDEIQSSVDSFVWREATLYQGILSLDTAIICEMCSFNIVYPLSEFIAQDSDLDPRPSLNQFCDSPVGCPDTNVECSDNGSLDFDEKCPV